MRLSNNDYRMPVLFLGHGSPMNAIEENEFVQGFKAIGKRPTQAQIHSLHIRPLGDKWHIRHGYGPSKNHSRFPGDFRESYSKCSIPLPVTRNWAQEAKKMVQSTDIGLDEKWGLDHGAWSVIKHLYPEADVPVIQMSLDYNKPAKYHFELAKELSALRKKGVLIIGSGNMVHNLGMVAWDKLNGDPFAFDWAEEANEKMKAAILNEDFQSLIDYEKQGSAFRLAIPTPEHYMPLIYTLALKEKRDKITFFNDQPVGGSLTMTSVKLE